MFRIRAILKSIPLFVGLILLLSGCSNSQEDKVVVACKSPTEQYILGEMIAQVIENKTDLKVERKFGITGGTATLHQGMIDGTIDIYPEYTGTAWMFVLKEEASNNVQWVWDQIVNRYKGQYNIRWMPMFGFNNTYSLAMKEELAEKHNIQTFSDLKKISQDLIFGAEYEFFEREDGYQPLLNRYDGLIFGGVKELDVSLKYRAVDGNQVQVINAYTTDGMIENYQMRILEDDLAFFPSYQAAPILRQQILEKYPELELVLSTLGQILNETEMTHLNYLVEGEQMEPRNVAEMHLKSKGIIE